MRLMQLIVVIGFMWACGAMAHGGQAASSAASATSTTVPGANRELVRSQAEVKRLQRDLGKQESDSKRASERLQQQDQKIAELRKQLQEMQVSPVAGQH
ncbi:hypothetical protein ACPPVV_06775 [Rhodanobacter sp. Col0626]|uniref:hypothetical protein n=1 Tax=Rhodanobacter sp. Col0626 TaxID=3415679 RepID=UPI003CED84A9